jgi:large subunit ribosomal protein L28e
MCAFARSRVRVVAHRARARDHHQFIDRHRENSLGSRARKSRRGRRVASIDASRETTRGPAPRASAIRVQRVVARAPMPRAVSPRRERANAMISHVPASDDFLWQVTKKHNAFTRASTSGHGARFSAEPGNVTAEVSFRASGLANAKTIDIREHDGGKGKPAATCDGKKLCGSFKSQAGEVKIAAKARPDLEVRSFRVFEEDATRNARDTRNTRDGTFARDGRARRWRRCARATATESDD